MRTYPWMAVIMLGGLIAGCAPAGGLGSAAPEGVSEATEESLPPGTSGEAREQASEAAGEYEYEEAEATEEAAADEVFAGEATQGQGGMTPLPTQAAAPAAPPVDMFFQDYGTNPFVDATQDNLSTFAVDVDTGSYTLMRSYLTDGYLPPAEAVRLEEFVNYFEQDYPVPQDQAFAIHMEAARTPFSSEETYVLRVGVQGYEVSEDARPDATLIFVIDVSGSMDMENRLGSVKEALNTLITQLRPSDKIGIVVYGSTGRVLLQPTEIGQTSEIRAAINQLTPDGSTNAEEGLRLAYQMATEYYEDGRINRLILCSDGVANVGVTGPDAILETVRQQANEGISLTTVGFGMGNYNDVLMEQLANDGNGQYYYVDTTNEAERIFVHGLTGTLVTIALDAKIQVEFNPETVAAYRLMGYENRNVADQDFRNDAVDAGEIGAGHSVTALYEIVPTQGAQGIAATVRLRWEDPETHEVTEIEQSIDAGAVRSFEETSPRFQLDAAAAAFADVLGDGAWSQNVSLDLILEAIGPAAAALGQDMDVQEFMQLLQRAKELGG